MPLGSIEPLTFVVGRQLALNQNVDAPTATRHGLVGALLGTGLIGPVIARELARRDAEATARSAVTSAPRTPTPTDFDAAVKSLLKSFQALVDSEKNTIASLQAQAQQLDIQVQTLQTAQTKALEKLFITASELSGKKSTGGKAVPEAKNTPASGNG